MYPILFSFGGIHIYTYGLSIFVSIIIGIIILKILTRKYELDFSFIMDNLLVLSLSGLVLGRLFHVIFKWNSYTDNIFRTFNLLDGGISMWGFILGVMITFTGICSYKKQHLNKWLDVLSSAFLIMSSFIYIGQFCGGQGFGKTTNFILGVYFENINSPYYAVKVHPTSLYMAIITLLLFVLALSLYIMRKRLFYGFIYYMTFILFSIAHIITEGLREDTAYWFFGYNAETFISFSILIIMSVFLFISIYRIYGNKIKHYLSNSLKRS